MKTAYIIEICQPDEMRYNSCGDYFFDDDGVIHIQVCAQGNWKYELLVAVHEIIEEALTRDRGITESTIYAFDLLFETKREPNDNKSEPGDADDSPYKKEHRFAETIERLIAMELNVDWGVYDNDIVLPGSNDIE